MSNEHSNGSSSDSLWDDPRITAYALNELSGDEAAAFEAELQDNPELAAAVAETRSLTGQLKSFYQDNAQATEPLEADRRHTILQSHSDVTSTVVIDSAKPVWMKSHWVKLCLAASVLLVVGGLVLPSIVDVGDSNVVSEIAMDATSPEMSANSFGYERTQLAPSQLAPSQLAPSQLAPSQLSLPTSDLDVSIAAPSSSVESLGADFLASDGGASITLGLSAPGVPTPDLDTSLFGADAGARFGASTEIVETLMDNVPKTNQPIVENLAVAPAPPRLYFTDEARRPVRVARNARPNAIGGPDAGGYGGSAEEARDSSLDGVAPQLEEADIPFIPELGMVIVSGSPAEVARVKELSQAIDDNGNGAIALNPLSNPGSIVRLFREEKVKADDAYMLMVTPRIIIEEQEELADTGYLSLSGREDDPNSTGTGPGSRGDQFDLITDNPFKRVGEHALSTFSVDVDTASYSKIRSSLIGSNRMPRPDAVRIEEMINYFDYNYTGPDDSSDHPFATNIVVTTCPWNRDHLLARIAIKGKEIQADQRPRSNLVFLLDTSGSMNQPNKLPLVLSGMKMLIRQLNEGDQVAIVTYAGSAGLVLDSTPASRDREIRRALTQLSAGGSTNGGQGIQLAYQTARDHFIKDGVNRIILCTDGDFNIGTTGTDELVRMVETEAKGGIFLTVLGFGMGNHNDAMLEQISGRGNGNYAFIDTEREAHKVLVKQTNSTLVTIAKDVKLQVEFNPAEIASYRLIGYENRVLAKEDFNDDKVDAGEIGAGHTVTALYELVPVGVEADALPPAVNAFKYQANPVQTEPLFAGELFTLSLRYKQPDSDTSTLIQLPAQLADSTSFGEADQDVRFAAAVAGFGMQLRRSDYKGRWTLDDVRRIAKGATGEDRYGFRAEFIEMVDTAMDLSGE